MQTQSFLAALLLLGCSGSEPKQADPAANANFVSTETSACISDHPPADPFDVGDVSVEMSASSAPSTLAGMLAECHGAGGQGCDESLISKEAARCIAQNEDFAAGLDDWSIGLAYDHSYRRVVWGVENTLVNRGPGDYSGQSLTLDAVSGRVLGRTNWSANP